MTLAAATLPFLDPTGPEIPAHEFALLWPELTPTELDLMVTDVAAHGVRNPILLYDDDGTRFILDGIHRYRAARRAGQPCPYTLFEGDRLAALAASNSLNDRRRHLNTSERLAVAAREQLAAELDGQADAPRADNARSGGQPGGVHAALPTSESSGTRTPGLDPTPGWAAATDDERGVTH